MAFLLKDQRRVDREIVMPVSFAYRNGCFVSWLADSPCYDFQHRHGEVAGLRNAINTANTNGADDVINLAANRLYVPTAGDISRTPATFPLGDSNHTVTINGNGATLRRSTDGGIADFRVW